jgi:hypothetical protein
LIDEANAASKAATVPATETVANGPVSLTERPDPLPRPGDPYRSHGRKNNRPESTLTFVTKDCSYEGFPYANLDRVRLIAGEKPGSGLVLLVRFAGSVVTDVRLEGRNLHPVYNLIQDNVLPWVWALPADADWEGDEMTT